MAALTTLAIVGSAALGAGAAVASYSANKKAAKQQSASLRRQEAKAKEVASLAGVRDDTGADIKLGRGDNTSSNTNVAGGGTPSARKGAVGARVGGLGSLNGKRPSAKLGL